MHAETEQIAVVCGEQCVEPDDIEPLVALSRWAANEMAVVISVRDALHACFTAS
jgi:hypothetical protein